MKKDDFINKWSLSSNDRERKIRSEFAEDLTKLLSSSLPQKQNSGLEKSYMAFEQDAEKGCINGDEFRGYMKCVKWMRSNVPKPEIVENTLSPNCQDLHPHSCTRKDECPKCSDCENEIVEKEGWVDVKDKLPDDGIEVFGQSDNWIHPDFNPKGIRICFISMNEWSSAKWNNDQDSWHTHSKWCCEDNGGTHFDPIHWMPLPNPPKDK